MLIDVIRLKSGVVEYIEIDEKVTVDDELLNNSNIIELENTRVSGKITKSNNDYHLDLILEGKMVIPCAVSLKPVTVPFEAEINGYVDKFLEEIGESSKKTQNTIDIFPIIWENILAELPMRVVSPDLDDLVTEGEGWRLVNDEVRTDVNPELQKLKDLFK